MIIEQNKGLSSKLLTGYVVVCAILITLGLIHYLTLDFDIRGAYFYAGYLFSSLLAFCLIKKGYYVLGKYLVIILPPYFFLITSVFLKTNGIMNTKLLYLLPRVIVLFLTMGPIIFFGIKHLKNMIITLIIIFPPIFFFDDVHRFFGINLHELDYDHSFYIAFKVVLYVLYFVPLASILLAQKTSILFKKQLLVNNEKIKSQQADLSHTHKELMDSVNYAKLLQQSLLPNAETLNGCFDEASVLFSPKDEISGDFYFTYEFDQYIYFGVGDCTGHGIPGAFLAAMSVEAMKTVIHEDVGIGPNQVLDKLREIAKNRFSLNLSEGRSDSMDAGICKYDKLNDKFYFAGGFINLLIIRQGEIIEINSDKCPVGAYPVETPFTLHEVSLEKNDIICLYSDGYVDQFGFDENTVKTKPTKFKRKRLQPLLLEINELPCESQIDVLKENLKKWSRELEQTDDITLFMVRH